MKEAEKTDEFHKHEAFDRAHLAMDQFHEYVQTHPAIQENAMLKEAAEETMNQLYIFYSLCGSVL